MIRTEVETNGSGPDNLSVPQSRFSLEGLRRAEECYEV